MSLSRTVSALATAVVAATLVVATPASPAAAYAARVRIDLRVLVVTDGGSGVDTVVAQLDREAVPYDLVDLRQSNRPRLLGATLSDTVNGSPRAKYQGVVLPNENALPADEMTALAAFETRFGVRQIDAYTAATPAVGLTPLWSGTLDGVTVTATAGGKAAGFGYLAGGVPVDDRDPAVIESWAYLGTPTSSAVTPLVTAPTPDGGTGTLIGAYAHDGREEMVVTLAANRYQTHATVLAHGLVDWLTRSLHLGHWRNWFSVHVDDIFLPDDRWHTVAKCTVGDGCNPGRDPNKTPYNLPIRMLPADVDALLAWQRAQGVKLDMVFNGGGSVDAGTADPLTANLLANKSELRWINHTYGHAYLGCVQDFSVVPWRCATDASGQRRWVSQADITQQIQDNVNWAGDQGIAINSTELVTGEHSGLRSLPQTDVDNPNLAPALSATGVRALASDASRDPNRRPVGPAYTVPRHPMNIYYNVATRGEEIDEYNWIYTSRANGGSGICENNPTSTCIAPLSQADFTGYLVPLEARIALDHVVSADPRPHYAHQSNLAEDRILYPVLDAIITKYRSLYAANTPLVNPRFAETNRQLARMQAWKAAQQNVEAYLYDGRVTVVNRGSGALDVPITVPAGTRTVTLSLLGLELLGGEYGESYGGTRSAWHTLSRNEQQLLRQPR
jgi:hypothetical protein